MVACRGMILVSRDQINDLCQINGMQKFFFNFIDIFKGFKHFETVTEKINLGKNGSWSTQCLTGLRHVTRPEKVPLLMRYGNLQQKKIVHLSDLVKIRKMKKIVFLVGGLQLFSDCNLTPIKKYRYGEP